MHTTKEVIVVKAIVTNTNGRKIKGLKSMSSSFVFFLEPAGSLPNRPQVKVFQSNLRPAAAAADQILQRNLSGKASKFKLVLHTGSTD
eukprot:SAG31_NODE_7265_length_1738_cov_1.101281_3_plen_88_part_00